jgi:hypothetical protein
MGEAVGNTIPWPIEGRGREEAGASETTPGGTQETKWVTIGKNLNPGEAVVIKGRLESEDIPVVVQQEAFGSFIGLTVGPLGSAKVLVPEPLAERALAILADTYEVDDLDEDGAPLEPNDDQGEDRSQ